MEMVMMTRRRISQIKKLKVKILNKTKRKTKEVKYESLKRNQMEIQNKDPCPKTRERTLDLLPLKEVLPGLKGRDNPQDIHVLDLATEDIQNQNHLE